MNVFEISYFLIESGIVGQVYTAEDVANCTGSCKSVYERLMGDEYDSTVLLETDYLF